MTEQTANAGNPDAGRSAVQYGAVLAYNGDDHGSVIAIYDELKRRGIEPWIDSRDHRPGDKWTEGFRSALSNTSVAIVFFGPNGTGIWQDEEIPLIHTQCVARNIVLIPVLLPGGVIPDDMPFATRSAVKFIAGSNDSYALDKLEFGITGRNPRDRRGRFEILAEVVRTEPNCFLAVSHATSSEIYEIMRQAALDVGLVVKQPREFTDDPHDVYSPEVVVAIRSATVILADGTPHPETKKPDADVMYETGVAEAFAKPMIFVSTPQTNALPLPIFVCNGTCSRIEYDPNEVNFAGRLREALASRLREIVRGLRPPHLLPNNNLGLSVAYSEIHHHRAVFWQPFEQIIHYGLSIKKEFAEILKPVHKMQQIIDLAHADAVAVKELADLGDSLRQFREVYDRFYKPRVTDPVLADAWKDTKAEAAEGFDVLLKISAETNDPNRSIQPIVRSSYRFFLIVETYLEEFLRADEALFSRMENPSTNTLHQVIHLHRDVQPLASSAELVPANACVMMFQLLELIGMRSELGEPSNGNERS